MKTSPAVILQVPPTRASLHSTDADGEGDEMQKPLVSRKYLTKIGLDNAEEKLEMTE